MMLYAKHQTMQQGQYMSEDSMWHAYDIVLPSGNHIY